jgi:hypothetical protein
MKRLLMLSFALLVATGAAARIVAGGNIDIDEPVDENLYVAGGNVTIGAPVSGNLRVAGGEVSIKSSIGGKVSVAGGHVTIDAPVGGNATVSGGTLELGPNARITGRLAFNGGHLEQDAGSQVLGGITQTRRHRRDWDGDSWGPPVARAMWTVGLMLLAAIIAGALPGPVRRMQDELATHPWLAALFGVVALICIPVAAVIVMLTIIGIPLGLLALLGYLALLLVGYVATSVVVSGLLLDRYGAESARRTGARVGAAVLATLVIASLGAIPFLGGFVGFAALVVGVGVIVAAIAHRKGPSQAAATPA